MKPISRKPSGKTAARHVKSAVHSSKMDTAVKQLAAEVLELKKEVRQLKKMLDPDLVLTKEDLRAIAAAENDLREGRTTRLC